MSKIEIKLDPIECDEVKALIRYHLSKMREGSPEESVHALDIEGLKQESTSLWTLWIDDQLAGCGALKRLNSDHAEIKTMRTYDDFLRKGVAKKILQHILQEAKHRGYKKLSLETGSANSFSPAHNLYRQFGFEECEPFAEYIEDPNSLFMTKLL